MTVALRICLIALLLSGCIPLGGGISITEPPPPPPEPPVPERFTGDVQPELVPSDVPGFSTAPSLGTRVYRSDDKGQWYRYAFNRWYLAFAWDGNWFPAGPEDLPRALFDLTPKIREVAEDENREAEKTREERLRELDEKLRSLEEQSP